MDAPGEKLIIRLWDTIDNAIGGWLSPWQTRRTGRARIDVRREELLALAQAERDVEAIRSGRKSLTADHLLVEGTELTDATSHGGSGGDPTATLAATAQRRLLMEQMRAEVNVAKAVLGAEVDLEDDPQEPPDRPIDEDWLFRWRDAASKVSASELQALWGRVLAGEVKSPGTFSLRTLEFLRNLAKEEARRVEMLAPFVIDNEFVYKDAGSMLESEGITHGVLTGLQDLGILDVGGITGFARKLSSAASNEFMLGLVSYTRVLVVTHQDPKKETQLPVYRLTSLGKEILKLGKFAPHDAYIRHVGQQIRNQGFKVVLARYQRVTETEGRYFDGHEL